MFTVVLPKLLLALSMILLLRGSVWAQTTGSGCGTLQAVYFGNGVWVVTEEQAAESLIEVRGLLKSQMTPSSYSATKFAVAYNKSFSKVSDLIEAARQIVGNEYPTLLLANILGLNRLARFFLPEDVIRRVDDLLNNEGARKMIQGPTSVADVASHVAAYKSDIGEGRKIVVVAHSQGNLFVNLAFQQLTSSEQSSFAIVPVASPDSIVRKSLVGHVTFINDLVIGIVQLVRSLAGLPGALSPNDVAEQPGSIDGHKFVENYITDVSSSGFISGGVIQSLTLLPAPNRLVQDGIITVTLTWGAQPDVDLHVFEPNGTHVYYASRQGAVGVLDMDDVTGFGPEHYTASCTNLESPNGLGIGTYSIGVNYFKGSGPETANINVKVPGTERMFSTSLGSERGPGGDQSPIPVARVIVTRDSTTGLLSFQVE